MDQDLHSCMLLSKICYRYHEMYFYDFWQFDAWLTFNVDSLDDWGIA